MEGSEMSLILLNTGENTVISRRERAQSSHATTQPISTKAVMAGSSSHRD